MKWFKVLRGLVFSVVLIVVPFTMGGPFENTRATLATVAFVLVGAGLLALVVRAAIKDIKRTRLEAQPVPEPEDAGMGFFRREREEREERERTGGAQA